MSFPFTPTSPAASEILAQSQPLIQQNFNSTNSILGVDHVSFGNSTGGQHKQTTFPGFSAPAMPAGQASVAFPAAGIANTGVPEYYYQNMLAKFPLSAIAAFGVFTGTGNVTTPMIIPLNGFNIATIASVGFNYTITLESGATSGNNVAVFFQGSNSSALVNAYTFISGVLTFTAATTGNISFLVLQI